jgi:hypothetical protein
VRKTATAALFGVALFVLLHPGVLGIGGLRLPGWDLARVFWADIAFLARCIESGESPLWNPYDRMGYPFVAEPQSAVFDPLTWLWAGLALLVGGAPLWITTVKVAAHYAIASSGIDAYLDHHGLPGWSRALGIVAFLAGARFDKLKDQSALWPTAWAAWFFLALERCVAEPSARRGAVLGAAGGMLVVSGYPPMAFRLGLLGLPLGLLLLRRAWLAAADRRAYLQRLARAGVSAIVVTAGLTSAQIVATTSVFSEIGRVHASRADLLAASLHPEHLLGFFAPHVQTAPLLMYIGALGPLLVVCALVRRKKRGEVIVFALLAFVGALLATGGNGPLLPLLIDLPGFRSFRIAGHYLVLFSFAGSMLIAHGAAALVELDATQRGRVGVLLAASALSWLVFGTPRTIGSWGFALANFALAFALLGRGERPAGTWVWALPLLLFGELFVVARPVANILQPPRAAGETTGLLESIDDHERWRVAELRPRAQRPGPRVGIRDFAGHRPALTDSRYRALYDAVHDDSSLLRVANVSVVAPPPKASKRWRRRLEVVEGEGSELLRVPRAWPRAFWTRDVVLAEDAEASLLALRRSRHPRAVIEESLVPAEFRPQLESLASAGRRLARVDRWREVEFLELHHTHLVFEVDAEHAGMFVLTEAIAPGWEVEVDGERALSIRANMISQALWLDAGSHRVSFEFRPRSSVALWWLWALTWLGLAGVGLSFARDNRARD